MGFYHHKFDVLDFHNVGHGGRKWIFNYRHSRTFGVVAKSELLYPTFHDPTKHKLHFYEFNLHELTLDGLDFYQLVVDFEGVDHSLLDTHNESPYKHDHIIGIVNFKQLAINEKLILDKLDLDKLDLDQLHSHPYSNTASHSRNLQGTVSCY